MLCCAQTDMARLLLGFHLIATLLFALTKSSDGSAGLSWIMSDAKYGVPTCPALCMTANDTLKSGSNVFFSTCRIPTYANQLWIYDFTSRSITVEKPSSSLSFCLEAQPSSVIVSTCLDVKAQKWSIDTGRSSIYSDLGMYLAMDYSSFLDSSAFSWHSAILLPENSNRSKILGLVDPSVQLNASLVGNTSSGEGNLVPNGGFELSSFDYLSRVQSYIEVIPGSVYASCFWSIDEGQVQIYGPAKQIVQGRLSMHLNGYSIPGAISQLISTRVRSTYFVSFLMAANTDCGDPVKTLSVGTFPANPEVRVYSFNSSGCSPEIMGWTSKSFMFRAEAELTNITFRSLTDGGCGPFLDDVRVMLLEDDEGMMAPPPSIHFLHVPAPAPAHSSNLLVDESKHRQVSSILEMSSAGIAGIIAGASVAAFVAGGLCCGILIFGLMKGRSYVPIPSKPSSISTSSTIDTVPVVLIRHSIGRVKCLPMSDIDRATHSFSSTMGRGSFGLVYLGEFDGVRVAVKRSFARQNEAEFFEKITMFSRVNHAHLVKLLAFSADQGEQMLVFEYIGNGSLEHHLHGQPNNASSLSWNTRIRIALEVAIALEYLHNVSNPPILHRNLKSANVLLTRERFAKLADYGISRHNREDYFHPRSTHLYGSLGYIDPHFLRTGVYTEKSDIYSFGIILLELITGRKALSEDCFLLDWAKGQFEMPEGLLDSRISAFQVKDLKRILETIKLCTQNCSEDRPDISEVVELLRQYVFSTQVDNTPETGSRPNSPATPC